MSGSRITFMHGQLYSLKQYQIFVNFLTSATKLTSLSVIIAFLDYRESMSGMIQGSLLRTYFGFDTVKEWIFHSELPWYSRDDSQSWRRIFSYRNFLLLPLSFQSIHRFFFPFFLFFSRFFLFFFFISVARNNIFV